MSTSRLLIGLGLGSFLLMVPDLDDVPARAGNPKQTPLIDPAPWRAVLADRLRAYGHRNWIVIADSAYPVQTSLGIETVVTSADQLDVLKAVLDGLRGAKHVRPNIYLDAELPLIAEADAPGIGKYRKELGSSLAGHTPRSLAHAEVIAKLDQAGRTFKILVLKTNLTIPYTSVFLELDCGYWSTDAEKRLRETMKSRTKDSDR